MGHRALVAVRRPDGRYDLGRSQWAGARWDLAGPLVGPGILGDSDQPAWRPVATADSVAAIVADHLDFQTHEALFLVSGTVVQPFLVCWFGLPGVDRHSPADGAVVSVDPDAPVVDGEYLRGWFEGTKQAVLAVVDRGALAPSVARALLADRVRSWTGDRTVYFGPTRPPDGGN